MKYAYNRLVKPDMVLIPLEDKGINDARPVTYYMYALALAEEVGGVEGARGLIESSFEMHKRDAAQLAELANVCRRRAFHYWGSPEYAEFGKLYLEEVEKLDAWVSYKVVYDHEDDDEYRLVAQNGFADEDIRIYGRMKW